MTIHQVEGVSGNERLSNAMEGNVDTTSVVIICVPLWGAFSTVCGFQQQAPRRASIYGAERFWALQNDPPILKSTFFAY
jgi:hypothetical protein